MDEHAKAYLKEEFVGETQTKVTHPLAKSRMLLPLSSSCPAELFAVTVNPHFANNYDNEEYHGAVDDENEVAGELVLIAAHAHD